MRVNPLRRKVAIFGGGIAGLSAAHELLDRGFEVTIYERRRSWGGKARSIPVPGSGIGGRDDLPGEHGFRFFPSFYRHITDTMRRIPYADQPGGVADNLVGCSMQMLARMGHAPIAVPSAFPRSFREIREMLEAPADFRTVGVSAEDWWFFLGRMLRFATSCDSRRRQEYGRTGWWQFVRADDRSKAYQTFFATGATRTLVANRAELADTLTTAQITAQLFYAAMDPSIRYDRLLNGPTSKVWLDPWHAHLVGAGLRFVAGAAVERIEMKGGRVDGVTLRQRGTRRVVRADHYLFALPVEVMARLARPAVVAADPTLSGVRTLAKDVEWMNGVQFFLREDVPLERGHQLYLDSPWALTSVSQAQFWDGFDWDGHGDGDARGCLSVCVSDWRSPGLSDGPSRGKPACQCPEEVVLDEVWEQIRRSTRDHGHPLFRERIVHSRFLDQDIVDRRGRSTRLTNIEPLLVNRVGSWDSRPEAYTAIPNLFLASDYVRTHTSLATMEAANEAARRAVNAILEQSDSPEPLAGVWPLEEPAIVAPLKARDARRYQSGLPWAPPFRLPRGWRSRFGAAVDDWLTD